MRQQKNSMLAIAALALLLTGTAQASSIEPGLWEIQSDIQVPGRPDISQMMQQAREQMKNLPPETRKMMEQQMGAGPGPDGAIRLCITPEETRGSLISEGKQQGECTFTKVSQSGNVWKGRMTCKNPPAQGEFTTTLHSSSHYSTVAIMTSKEGRMDMKSDARRISGDCGNLSRSGRGGNR